MLRGRSPHPRSVATVALWALAGALAVGQAPSPGGARHGLVIETGSFTPFVENMDRSLAFYHDGLGMEVPPLPATGGPPYNAPNPRLLAFFNIPGAKERHQSARVPGIRTGVSRRWRVSRTGGGPTSGAPATPSPHRCRSAAAQVSGR